MEQPVTIKPTCSIGDVLLPTATHAHAVHYDIVASIRTLAIRQRLPAAEPRRVDRTAEGRSEDGEDEPYGGHRRAMPLTACSRAGDLESINPEV